MSKQRTRHLIVCLGDQLNRDSAAFDHIDASADCVWMAEVMEESTHVRSSKVRTALFLSAMRHFRSAREKEGFRVDYRTLDANDGSNDLAAALVRSVAQLKPARVVVVQPGEWRVQELLERAAKSAGVPIDILPDRHFLCSMDEFRAHAAGRKQLRMEYFYREQRRKHAVLLDRAGGPEGGEWNLDHENRESFGAKGPEGVRKPRAFKPDAATRDVIALVNRMLKNHPGDTGNFDWPVTPAQAEEALDDFIEHRLAHFGRWEDAMWTDEPVLFHSRLSAALNLKLLNPRKVIQRVEKAYRSKAVPLASAEGFIRQVLGWREYVRGIYWLHMPNYVQRNALKADQPLPDFYWTGETDMRCLQAALKQTLDLGYAHHIQRLMVTGLYALLLGVRPQEVHEWYLSVYVDAVEWVELPNTLGMSQYGDGGVMASKPYAATGKYISRMSNYCKSCRFDPAKSEGEDACPFTTLYWDFLLRHAKGLGSNPRMALQVKNAQRLTEVTVRGVRARAQALRASGGQPAEAGG
jgi:deoxyribodipyrimidine photolyase-related protein